MEEEKLTVKSNIYHIVYKVRKLKSKYNLNVEIIDEDGFYPSKKDYYFDKIYLIERIDKENTLCTVIVHFDTGVNYKYELQPTDADELVELLAKMY